VTPVVHNFALTQQLDIIFRKHKSPRIFSRQSFTPTASQLIVPSCADDLVIKLHERLQIVFLVKAYEILLDFGRTRVIRRPIWIWFERISVNMGRNVTCTALKHISSMSSPESPSTYLDTCSRAKYLQYPHF
jgi:hypothetical protein